MLDNDREQTIKPKWKNLAFLIGNVNDSSLLLHKLNSAEMQTASLFYTQVLKSWYSFFSVMPNRLEEILTEKITQNKFITIGGRPITNNFGLLRVTGITLLSELVKNAHFKSRHELETEYNCIISDLDYNSIIAAIPNTWKKAIRNLTSENKTREIQGSYDINHLKINLSKLTNKIVYESLTFKNCIPTAVNKWIEYYPFLETIDWDAIYELPSKITKDLKLQNLQYSIVHRYAVCNYNLKLWQIKDSFDCQYCLHIDTIEHAFFYCSYVKVLWNILQKLNSDVLKVKFDLTVLEVLLGIPCEKFSPTHILNLLILASKQFIFKTRIKQHRLCEYAYMRFILEQVKAEVYLLKIMNKNVNESILIYSHVIDFLEKKIKEAN